LNALSANPQTGELYDYFGGLADLKTRCVRFIGEPLQRIAEDHLRILRFFRFHARFGAGAPDEAALDACTARANDLMALSRERIADELLKLLGLPNPSATVGIMLQRGILKPVLPEITPERLCDLQALLETELKAQVAPDPLRRLLALLPREPELADTVGARLKLSKKARKQLICGASPDLASSPHVLAYRLGTDCAVNRLLLADRAEEAAGLLRWQPPRLPLGGGMLIARGLTEGPIVARTLRLIEDRWVNAGFPAGLELEEIVEQEVAMAKR
jgi:poly(A) polymerase